MFYTLTLINKKKNTKQEKKTEYNQFSLDITYR